MYQRLHDSMVRGVHMCAEREGTLAITKERRVPTMIANCKLVVAAAEPKLVLKEQRQLSQQKSKLFIIAITITITNNFFAFSENGVQS